MDGPVLSGDIVLRYSMEKFGADGSRRMGSIFTSSYADIQPRPACRQAMPFTAVGREDSVPTDTLCTLLSARFHPACRRIYSPTSISGLVTASHKLAHTALLFCLLGNLSRYNEDSESKPSYLPQHCLLQLIDFRSSSFTQSSHCSPSRSTTQK